MIQLFAASVLILAFWHDDQAILSFQFRWNSIALHAEASLLLSIFVANVALINHLGPRLLIIKAPLLHNNVKCSQIFVRYLH